MSHAPVRYRVLPANPAGHLFSVTLEIDAPAADGQVLSLPAWIPGSYLIRDFAMHITVVTATSNGVSLGVRKLDKQTWKVDPCTGPLRVSYEVYAWDLSVRKAHLDQTHGYFNGTSLFLEAHGFSDGPHEVRLDAPEDPACAGWKVATTLPRVDGDALGFGTFVAADYDELVDHPVEMGTFLHARFEARGIPHEVAITGRGIRCDVDRLCEDLRVICEGHLDLMGIPADLDRYLFQIMVVGSGYGGLEHRTSTSLICSRGDLPLAGQDEVSDGYRTLLALASHEYFHLWNVKRIKPAVFTPYDLRQETPTTLLWAFEGITSYYEPLGLVRTGRIDAASYLELLGRKLTDVMRRPGRHKQSVTESSFDAWTKFYKQDENAPNAIVSYYTKGAMVALALDLRLRRDSAVTLDDVMRELYARHGAVGVGVPEDGIERLTAELSGLELTDFFDEALRGTGDALWEQVAALLADFGIAVSLRPREGSKDRGGKPGKVPAERWSERGDLGITLKNGNTTVQWVREDSAGMRAGLSAGDQIIAIDGIKAGSDLLDRVAERRPGDGVTLHVFRRDELRELLATLDAAARDTVVLTVDDDAPAEAVSRRDAWLGTA